MKDLKEQLSEEWKKPKAKNCRGEQPRDYDKIHGLQDQINEGKTSSKAQIARDKKEAASLKAENNTPLQRIFSIRKKSLKQKAAEKLAVKRDKQVKSSK